MKNMNKFIIIEGGCRGLVNSIETVETESSLQELADEYWQHSLTICKLEEFIDNLLADFGLDFTFYESATNAGTIAVIAISEEEFIYIIMFQESLFQALEEDSVETMGDVEDLIGLEY